MRAKGLAEMHVTADDDEVGRFQGVLNVGLQAGKRRVEVGEVARGDIADAVAELFVVP